MVDLECNISFGITGIWITDAFLAGCGHMTKPTAIDIAMRVVGIGRNTLIVISAEIEVIKLTTNGIDRTMTG